MSNDREYMQASGAEAVNSAERTEIVNSVADEMGIIAENTRVIGDVTTRGHLAIAGTIEGNISAKGNVIITGVVKGNITCDNLMMERSQATTEIRATGHVAVKEGVTINGDIYCKDITIMGTVNGNINASGSVALSSIAIVNGNIRAASFGVEFGAKLVGSIAVS